MLFPSTASKFWRVTGVVGLVGVEGVAGVAGGRPVVFVSAGVASWPPGPNYQVWW